MSWPVSVTSLGSLETGSLLWTQRGALQVTVVLRTTYTLAAGPPSPLPADAVDGEDRHYGDDPARAVRTAADLAPRVPLAEIVHAGAVVAPAGVTVVRLALSRQGRSILDKRAVASAINDSPGLGPLGRWSAERLAVLRGEPEPLMGADGVLALPDDYDFGFHQCAPPDQRCDRLAGGDQILLANLHPDLAEVIVSLPTRAPAARAILGGEEAPLVVECKRVLLDTDRRRLTLTWYAELELPSLDAVPHLRIEARAPDAPAPQAAPAFDARQLLRKIAETPEGHGR